MDQHETNRQVAAYTYGDLADPDDIAIFRSTEENCIALSRLQPNDPCFILRSGGRITFARVVEHNEVLTVQVKGDGSTKSIPPASCMKYIRLLRQNAFCLGKSLERHSAVDLASDGGLTENVGLGKISGSTSRPNRKYSRRASVEAPPTERLHSAPDSALDGELAENEGLGKSSGSTSRPNRKYSRRVSVDAPPTGSSRRPSRRATEDGRSSKLHSSLSGLKVKTSSLLQGKEEKIFRHSTSSDGEGSILIEDIDQSPGDSGMEHAERLRPQRRSSKTSSRPTLERRSSCSALGQSSPVSKSNLHASFESGLNRPAQKAFQRFERLESITSEIDEIDVEEEEEEDTFEEEICLPNIAIDEETTEVSDGGASSIPTNQGHGSSTALPDTDELSLFEIVHDRRSSHKKNATTAANKLNKPKKKNPINEYDRVSQMEWKKPHDLASDDDSNAAVDDGFDTRGQRRRKGKKSARKSKSTRKKVASSSQKVVEDPEGKPSRKDGESKGETTSTRSSATQSSGEGSASPNSVIDKVDVDVDSWRPLPLPGFQVKFNEQSLMSAFSEIKAAK